jgi:hypothetical protein
MSSLDLTPQRLPQSLKTEQPRISGAAETIKGRMLKRHAGLMDHNPVAMNAACEALAAMGAAADNVSSFRCDRSERHRQMQLDGTTGLQFEDAFAMGLENEDGKATVLAGVRVLLATLGYRAVPMDARGPSSLPSLTATTARESGEFLALITEAPADGRIDFNELAAIERGRDELVDAASRAAIVAAREAQRGAA